MSHNDSENFGRCKRIADDVTLIADGAYIDDDENVIGADEYEGLSEEEQEAYSPYDLYEYISNCLDYTYTLNAGGSYRCCRVWVTLGGPNVAIDTSDMAVLLWWGLDTASYGLSIDVCNAIDDVVSEIVGCQ